MQTCTKHAVHITHTQESTSTITQVIMDRIDLCQIRMLTSSHSPIYSHLALSPGWKPVDLLY